MEGNFDTVNFVCPKGDGNFLTSNIAEVADQYVSPSQIASFCGDGVYYHCDVGSKLNKHYNINCIFTWDQMHLAATVDSALRNPKLLHASDFAWLNTLTNMLGKGVKFVAWGGNFFTFFQISKELQQDEGYDFKACRPVNFSETKFANSAALVYSKFRQAYPALIITLEKVKEDLRTGVSTEREKAKRADEVQGGIMDYLFTLTLSVCVDTYSIYGAISNILQLINILPHEKMDLFNKLLQKLSKMKCFFKREVCPCMRITSCDEEVDDTVGVKDMELESEGIPSEVCYWPALHKDILEVQVKGKYRGVVLGQLQAEQSRTRVGSKITKQWLKEDTDTVIKKVYSRADKLVTFLEQGLSEKVYSDENVKMMNHTRRLLDLKSVLQKVKNNGYAHVSDFTWKTFRTAALYFEPEVFLRVEEDSMRMQHRDFHRVLEMLAKTDTNSLLSSMELLKKFLDLSGNLSR